VQMKYLVEINSKNIGTETNSVNAKELHTFIQAKSRFNDWIKNRIKKYDFKENQDYIIVTTLTGGRPSKEYYITLDMAKELSMVENNDRGREARRWFIEVAKKYQNNQDKNTHFVINGYKSQIAQHNKKIQELQSQIDNNPKINKDNILEIIEKGLKYEKNKIDASDHNNFLECVFQMKCFYRELEEVEKAIQIRKDNFNCFFKRFEKKYPRVKDYQDKLDKIGLRTNLICRK